jgi:prepilin-type N-terminal cleavage/methylation domain-containing protein
MKSAKFKKSSKIILQDYEAMSGKSDERGFSLLELMIAVVIFLVAIAAVFQVMKLASVERNTVNNRTDSIKSARIALNYIRRDILNAGLSYHNFGGNIPDNWANLRFNAPADSDTQRDWLTAIVTSNNTNTNALDASSPTDAITIVSRDLSFNNGDLMEFVSTSASGNDVLIKVKNSTANCSLYDVYLIETGTTQVVGMVTAKETDGVTIRLGFGDPLGVNQSATATGEAKSLLIGTNIKGTLKKINIVSYSVDNGTLRRRSFGNFPLAAATEQIETHELIYDVQNMQIKFLMNDGTSKEDPSSGNNGRANQLNMNSVVDVEVELKILEPATTQPSVNSPVTMRDIISTRNLRYTAG